MSADTRERAPLLNSPLSLARHHRLAPPSIRFPGQSVKPGFAQQDSYGFPASDAGRNHSDETLVEQENEPENERSESRASSARFGMSREDSKTYTSFPKPANSKSTAPWIT